jgi:leucine-zipper-like transcriptional regulator 1
VDFNSRLWVIGGDRKVQPNNPSGIREYFNDVWSSADGKEWRLEVAEAPFSPRGQFSCLVFEGRIWVIGGVDENRELLDIWSSENGITWRREGASREVQELVQGVVYKDRMWLVARSEGSDRSVFSSADGIHWSAAGRTPVQNMRDELLTVYDGKLWFLSATYAGEPARKPGANETWYSSDGTTWKKSIPATPGWFSPWRDSQSYEYKGKLWVMFGVPLAFLDTQANYIWHAKHAPWP